MPSLAQLDQAVREFIAENPADVVTVVVDASFGHRIDPSEVPAFEEAEVAGEVVSPPAGAIGRGDAFLLRIAEKTGATVLSNDSFQEFHGEHTWLFDKGRLIGGKPVPGVGWIFMDRTPVRGAKSREVTKEAKRKKREVEAGPTTKSTDYKAKSRSKSVDRAIARATEEVVEPKAGGKSHRRRGGAPPAEPVNEPLAFITFIAAHPLGSDVVGSVLEYSSHGAFVEADGARCYIPLSAMGDPAPRRAREVVTKGETRIFVVQAFDPQRRGIELALPGFARIAGEPTPETVEAEIGKPERVIAARKAPRRAVVGEGRPAAKAAAEKAPAKRAAAQKAPAEKAPAKRAAAEKAAAEKVPAKKAPAKRAAAQKKAPAEKAPANKAAAEKAPAEKAPAEKAPAKKVAARKAATGEQAEVAAETAPTPARKAPPGKSTAEGLPAARAAAKKAAARKAPPEEVAGADGRSRKAAAAKKAAPAQRAPVAGEKAGAAGKAPARKSGVKKESTSATSRTSTG